ncbi:LOW QUALITY PROTEIN: serine/threonine-protein kinase/endoribonuclease IRE1b-like [Primulina eburnea]|uniref:LOW QUALITY PROTEIN: serine/threonine-protein kinase/endoribonuclease IRE1b-like n=1 Tax=Primulina eburnea TaxID=1245227 RepID=UPI003C6CBDD0
MRGFWIPFLFMVILVLAIVYGARSKSDKDPDSKNLPSTVEPTINKNDTVVMAAPDGTVYLIENSTGKVFGSFSSGPPIYSSYQKLPDREAEKLDVSAEDDELYIDFGEDWKLYWHKTGHKIEKLPSAEELIKHTPFVSAGGVVLGSKRTAVFLVDAKTGKVVRTVRSDDLSSVSEQDSEESSILIRNDIEEWLPASPEDMGPIEKPLYVTRTDYALKCTSLQTGKIMWYLMFADVEASFQCEGVQNFLGGVPSNNEFIPIHGLDMDNSLQCQSRPAVIHIRGRASQEPLFIDDRLQYTLPGGRLVSLSASDHITNMKAMENLLALHHSNGIENMFVGKEKLLALPTSEPTKFTMRSLPSSNAAQISSHVELHGLAQPLLWSFMLSSALVPVAMAFFFYVRRTIFGRHDVKLHEKSEDVKKVQNSVLKKKKGRKSGVNKKNTVVKEHGNDEAHAAVGVTGGFEDTEMSSSYWPPNCFDKNDTYTDRRKIGKLIVTNKVIAKGSNGTIVLEGNYDGRLVAVKRLVRTHHDVAVKEIQNLIASDQHPNIVRWYGVEYDQDFVYLSLERCTCSLHELVSFYNSRNCESPSFSNGNMQLLWALESSKEFDLWKTNGYPSVCMLKLMKDIVCGLAHLHELGIIHRDLKPQNVLVIKDRSTSAKISDMGISKRLDGDLTSLTKNATGHGSSGWQAPEQLRRERQTRAIDLFSLGCVLFFCITGGKHPFGENFERDINIVNNRKDLFLIDNIPEAIDLISRLLDPRPDLRPTAVEVSNHPMFWNSETRLSFLRDVSDRVELEDRENASQLLEALESRGRVAFGGKWDENMDNAIINDIGRYRRYKFDSVRDLLRVIRNKLNHYRELSKEIQVILGSVPEGFDSYFSARFPKLLIEVYGVILAHCVDEEIFEKYLKSSLF